MKEKHNEENIEEKANALNSIKGAGKGKDRQKAVTLRLSKIDLTKRSKQ